MYFTVCYTVFRANKNSKIKMKKTNQPYYNIRNSKGRYSSKRLYNLNHFISLISFILIAIASVFIYGHVDNYIKEKNYNECFKQYEGANFISCDTDEYFVYRADKATSSVKTPKNALKSVVNIKDDSNCVYTIKDSKGGEFKVKCEFIKKIVAEFGEDKILVAIVFQESGFNPLAKNKNVNGSIDAGVFQLNSNYWTIKQGNFDHSVSQAKKCKEQNGYNCWVAYSSKAYKNYLDEAEVLLSKLN